jgi:hypothetical protein
VTVASDQQIDARFAQMDEHLRRMESQNEARLGRVESEVSNVKGEVRNVKDDLRSLKLAFQGDQALGIKGFVETLMDIAEIVKDIKSRMDTSDQNVATTKKFLGFLGLRDLPTILGILGGIYALGTKMHLW